MMNGLYSMPIIRTLSLWSICQTTMMFSCAFCAFMPGQVTFNTIRPCGRSSMIKSPTMLDLKTSLKTSMLWNVLL